MGETELIPDTGRKDEVEEKGKSGLAVGVCFQRVSEARRIVQRVRLGFDPQFDSRV